MLVYYDIIADKEIASDSFEQKEIIPGVLEIQGKRIVVQEAEIDIGANASAEADGEDESCDASEAKTVINVVHAANLQKVELDKKEYSTMQKSYWKKLIEALNKKKFYFAGLGNDWEVPADKAEAKKAEEDAVAELSSYDRRAYDEIKNQIASFKEHFEGLQKFVKDVIVANFDECEFYTCEEGELGQCQIIPARYVGEATAPVFYFFADGCKMKKE